MFLEPRSCPPVSGSRGGTALHFSLSVSSTIAKVYRQLSRAVWRSAHVEQVPRGRGTWLWSSQVPLSATLPQCQIDRLLAAARQ